jgi:hypothetical protein
MVQEERRTRGGSAEEGANNQPQMEWTAIEGVNTNSRANRKGLCDASQINCHYSNSDL